MISLLLSGYIGHITKQRILSSLGGLVTAIVGMVLIVALPLENHVGRLIGYYLTQASATPFVALLSLISSNVAGYTKKTTVASFFLIGYCAGNIIGEYGVESILNVSDTWTRQHTDTSRPTNIPPRKRPTLRPRRSDYHCLLGCIFVFAGWSMDVVPSGESEEVTFYCPTRVCEIGESRVSALFCLFCLLGLVSGCMRGLASNMLIGGSI